MRRKRVIAVLILVAAAVGGWWYSRPEYRPVPPQIACLVGLYRLDDGRFVDLSPQTNAAALRWRLVDGRSGRLGRNDDGSWTGYRGWSDARDTTAIEPGTCDAPALRFDGQRGQRVEFTAQDTRFRGDGEEFAGRLVMPAGDAPVPIAVLVHGSERWSALTYSYWPRLLAAHGVGVFVYDKRGTGRSTGRYSQDFSLLANDAVAALREARRVAGPRAARIGFFGGSQAGWIAPLAATRSDAAFVAIGYGLADSPLAEDRDQVMLDLKRRGHGPEVLAKAREVTDATAAVMASGFRDGYDALAAVKDKYGREPWWKDMRGEFTGELANRPPLLLRWFGPLYDEGTTWRHDPMPVLHALKVPLLWVLAGADREAPPEETRARLRAVAQAGGPVTLVEFPDTDHGMLEFVESADGARERTRITEGYHALVVDWIRDGRAAGAYGRAQFLARAE